MEDESGPKTSPMVKPRFTSRFQWSPTCKGQPRDRHVAWPSSLSEQKPHLELKHARRIDVGECRKRVRRTTNCDDLTERWIGRSRIAVGRLRTPENVRVVEDIEALESQENGSF